MYVLQEINPGITS
nr:RecName: Full=Unknown protein CP 12 from 2D-PAGE [Clostridium pasteurianum]